MLKISLDDSQFQHRLNQLLHNITHTTPMMKGIAQELENLSKENFANQAWGKDKWKPSQAATKQNRNTLYARGELHDSIETRTGTHFAQIGSNMKYAAIHHIGGQAGRGKKFTLPARPYLPINSNGQLQDGAKQTILKTVIESLKSGIS